MDVSPQMLRDVEFRERLRGYDQDEVDEFLERVGVAIAQMQDRLRDAQARIEHAEARADQAENGARDRGDADETLRRTLVLAQRTADAAIAEARDDAARAVADAEERAARTLGEARERADQIVAEAEERVRVEVGAVRDRLRAEIADLESEHERRRRELDGLGAHIDDERERIVAQLDELRAALAEPDALRIDTGADRAPGPGRTGSDDSRVVVDASAAPAGGESAPDDAERAEVERVEAERADAERAAEPTPAPAVRPTPDPTAQPQASGSGASDLAAPSRPSLFGDPAVGPEPLVPEPQPLVTDEAQVDDPRPGAPRADETAAPLDVDLRTADEVDPGATSDEPAPEAWPDAGPATQPTPMVDVGTSFGGSHLDELRRAVADDPDTEDSDAAMAAFFDQDLDGDERGRRFGRRR